MEYNKKDYEFQFNLETGLDLVKMLNKPGKLQLIFDDMRLNPSTDRREYLLAFSWMFC